MLALLAPASASAAEPTRIIVKREPGLNAAERADLRADAGVQLVDTLSLPRTEVVTASADRASGALRTLNADRDVEYAELDHSRRAAAAPLPNDSLFDFLWGLNNVGQSKQAYFYGGLRDADIDAPEAWAQSADTTPVTGSGVQVAVIDSGVDDDSEDLHGKVALARTFVGGVFTPGAEDENGHGTHVAGTIAARRNNNRGVAGVAPGAEIIALRAVDGETGVGYDSDIAEAIHYATTEDEDHEPARIVNLSLGGDDPAETIVDAIQAAPDTLFVVAAGNTGTNNDTHLYMPCDADEPNVICVGASTNRERRAAFSNYGAQNVDLFAPGEDIASTVPSGTGYALKSGTSMAAPQVAGVAALILQTNPDISPSDLSALLLETVDKRPAYSGISVSGGRLNAGLAVASALTGGSPPDSDGDHVADAIDSCAAAGSGPEGCPPSDTDSDGRVDLQDNCPGDPNSPFTDTDRDGDGDACDDDDDADGVPDFRDACRTVKAATANGCPATPVKPTPTPTPTPNPTTPTVKDTDGDGRKDNVDTCPFERAGTLNGCPLSAVTALSAKPRKRGGKRYAAITVRTSRAARVQILVQRKKGKRWVKVTSRTRTTSSKNRVALNTKRLKRGRYRVLVVLSSAAGRSGTVTKSFRIR